MTEPPTPTTTPPISRPVRRPHAGHRSAPAVHRPRRPTGRASARVQHDDRLHRAGRGDRRWFTIQCASSGTHPAAVSGGPIAFTLNPGHGFGDDESCTVTITATQVTDSTRRIRRTRWRTTTHSPSRRPTSSYAATPSPRSTPSRVGADQRAGRPDARDRGRRRRRLPARQRVRGLPRPGGGRRPDADPATSEGIFVFDDGCGADVAAATTSASAARSPSSRRPDRASNSVSDRQVVRLERQRRSRRPTSASRSPAVGTSSATRACSSTSARTLTVTETSPRPLRRGQACVRPAASTPDRRRRRRAPRRARRLEINNRAGSSSTTATASRTSTRPRYPAGGLSAEQHASRRRHAARVDRRPRAALQRLPAPAVGPM